MDNPAKKERLSLRCHPHLHCVVITRRGDALAIRRPRHRFHNIGMATVGEDVAATGCIPHLCCVVITRRGDALAIGRPCYRFHNVGMPAVGEDGAAIGGIPDLHCLITTPRGDALAIGRPRHRFYDIGMSMIGEDVATIGGIPDLHRAISAPGGNALTIGYTCPPDRVPCHRIHSTRMPVIGVESCTPRERSRRSWSCRLLTARQQDKTAPSRTHDGQPCQSQHEGTPGDVFSVHFFPSASSYTVRMRMLLTRSTSNSLLNPSGPLERTLARSLLALFPTCMPSTSKRASLPRTSTP